MLKKVCFIFGLVVLTIFSTQSSFAKLPDLNIIQIIATPTPTPAKIIIPSGLFHTIVPVTATPTTTPTPSATAVPTNTPTITPTPTSVQNSPEESVIPTTQVSPSVSPTPTPTPNQQTLIAGLSKEMLIITSIILLAIVVIFLARWNIIKKWLNKKTS